MTDNEIISKLERLSRDDYDSFPMAVYDLICKKNAEIMMTNNKMYQLLGQAEEKRLLQKIQQVKINAVKKFAARLCEGRVSNDPVVIAVQAELKEMICEEE